MVDTVKVMLRLGNQKGSTAIQDCVGEGVPSTGAGVVVGVTAGTSVVVSGGGTVMLVPSSSHMTASHRCGHQERKRKENLQWMTAGTVNVVRLELCDS